MNIEHYESQCPNHWDGRYWQVPDVIVMHITEGGMDGAISWLLRPDGSSSHFIVGANGRIAQLVKFEDGAWCNGDYNNPTAKIVKTRGGDINPNTYTMSIEHEGYSYKERYGALTEAQYQASLYCCKMFIDWYQATYNKNFSIDRDHIIGHYEINPSGKPNCPAPGGTNFPFDRLIRDLKEYYEMKYEIGKVIYPIEDITLYSTAGYPNSVTSVLKKGTKCIVKKYDIVNGLWLALTDEKGAFLSPATWTNQLDKFTTEEPKPDFESKYNEELAKNTELSKQIATLNTEIARLNLNVESDKAKIDNLTNLVSTKDSEILSLKQENVLLEEKIDKLNKELLQSKNNYRVVFNLGKLYLCVKIDELEEK